MRDRFVDCPSCHNQIVIASLRDEYCPYCDKSLSTGEPRPAGGGGLVSGYFGLLTRFGLVIGILLLIVTFPIAAPILLVYFIAKGARALARKMGPGP